jgi:hypothetical protein
MEYLFFYFYIMLLEDLNKLIEKIDSLYSKEINTKVAYSIEAQYFFRIHLLFSAVVLNLKLMSKANSLGLNNADSNSLHLSSLLILRPAVVASLESIYILHKLEKNPDNLEVYKIFYGNLIYLRNDIIKSVKIGGVSKPIMEKVQKQLEVLYDDYSKALINLDVKREDFINYEYKIPSSGFNLSTATIFEKLNKNPHFDKYSWFFNSFVFLSKIEHFGIVSNKLLNEEYNAKKLLSDSIRIILLTLLELTIKIDTFCAEDESKWHELHHVLTQLTNTYNSNVILKELNETILVNTRP